jgi:tellurite resistance protein TerC
MMRLVNTFTSSGPTTNGHVDLDVQAWHWVFLLGVISVLLLIDLLVIHRKAHVVGIREAAVESSVWIGLGLLFAVFVAWQFGASATGEYFGSYLMEKSLSVDNVFIWAMLFTHFQIPRQFQHRVLFWGIFGALVLRSGFIFGGLAVIEIFEPALLIMGLFLVYTAFKLSKGDDSDDDFNPSEGRTLRIFKKMVPSTDEIRGHALFVRDERNGLLATPLFAVLVLVELTDIVFAVDSVPAVLSVTSEQLPQMSSQFLGFGRCISYLRMSIRDLSTFRVVLPSFWPLWASRWWWSISGTGTYRLCGHF